MSAADLIALVVVTAGLTAMAMGAPITIAIMYLQQEGTHVAARDVREHHRAQALRYHHLSPDERRIWRQQTRAAAQKVGRHA